jgi:hypothetical protein
MRDVTARFEEMRLLRQKITRTSRPGGRKRHRLAVLHGASHLLGRSAGSIEEFTALLSEVEAPALFPLRNVLTHAVNPDWMRRT